MNKKIKICFLADKHHLYDDRIYWKMSISLLNKGYEVFYLLIGNENKQGQTKEGVHFQILKVRTFSKNRYLNFLLKNMVGKTNYKNLFECAKKIKADIYHFHDLNINRIAKKLKGLDHQPIVIYDARDPFAVNVKDYIGAGSSIKWFVNLYADYIDKWEKNCAKNYDFVISNEENVRDLFRKHMPKEKVDVIYNYTYFHHYKKDLPKKYDLIYCGGITELRGALVIIEAIRILKEQKPRLKMLFLGPIFDPSLKNKMQHLIEAYTLNDTIILKDTVPYHDVIDFYNQSKIGLGIFLPSETHKITLQIKIFEYMAMGLPIIGSNFGHIKNYILNEQVGLIVNPTKPQDIAQAALTLLEDKNLYNQFSSNGIKACTEKYHWSLMEEKLFGIYDKLLKDKLLKE